MHGTTFGIKHNCGFALTPLGQQSGFVHIYSFSVKKKKTCSKKQTFSIIAARFELKSLVHITQSFWVYFSMNSSKLENCFKKQLPGL